jgi:hypothetical protein
MAKRNGSVQFDSICQPNQAAVRKERQKSSNDEKRDLKSRRLDRESDVFISYLRSNLLA